MASPGYAEFCVSRLERLAVRPGLLSGVVTCSAKVNEAKSGAAGALGWAAADVRGFRGEFPALLEGEACVGSHCLSDCGITAACAG
jgi:hypothetical protein